MQTRKLPKPIRRNPTTKIIPFSRRTGGLYAKYGSRLDDAVRAYLNDPRSDEKATPQVPQSRLHLIGERFQEFQKCGEGYKACCPAHDDSRPSLSIGVGEDGRILLNCLAGCKTEKVLAAAGLTFSDLFPDKRRIVSTYDYLDESGSLLYQAVRYDPKEFRQRIPDGNGGWIWKLNRVRRVLYRLPELLASMGSDSQVFIVEGEKDADRLAKLGLTATTNAGGAGNFKPEFAESLRGRSVAILADNDEPGRAHAEWVASLLNGVAESIKIVDLPGLPEKGDVSDWLDAGGTKEQLLALVDELAPAEINLINLMGNKVNYVNSFGPETSADTGNTLIRLITPVLGDPAYLGIVGRFLKSMSSYTEATDAGILAHLLPAVGTLIGPGPHVYAGNRQPARIFTALVGPTNTGRKGTASGPVEELMRKVDTNFWTQQRVGGMSSGEGLICKVADKVEKTEDGLEIVPVEKRLYVIEPEFSRTLASMRRDGNTLSQVIREAFDNGDLSTLTVNPRQASGAHINIVVHITPEELAARFNHIEMANGFGNRFLWFAVRSEKLMPRTEPIPPKAFGEFISRLKSMSSLPDRNISLTTDAVSRWEKLYPELREDRPGFVGAMTARGSSMVSRLALLYTLLEGKPKVGVEHLEAALAVWQYSSASAETLFGQKTGTTVADRILRLLLDGPMKRNEFTDHLSKSSEEIQTALSKLESAGRVRKVIVKPKGPGRPAEMWERVPTGRGN